MGSEARCILRYGGRVSEGKALLESDVLVFRGDVRLSVKLSDITSVEAADGRLAVTFGGEVAVFEIGPVAERWAARIRNPRTRIDKLGVKPGAEVVVLGVEDPDFLAELRARTPNVTFAPPETPAAADVVFVHIALAEGLARLGELEGRIARDGAIWVVSPKGAGAAVKDTDVMAAAKTAGLVDTKVVGFSPTHTALKLVIPRARRG